MRSIDSVDNIYITPNIKALSGDNVIDRAIDSAQTKRFIVYAVYVVYGVYQDNGDNNRRVA